jgi:CheY-like chemotaxis protein
MDGFEFLAELRQREEGCSAPVLLLTARDLTAVDRQRLLGPIEKVLPKGSLGHEQLLAEVSALAAGVRERSGVRSQESGVRSQKTKPTSDS